MSFTFAEKEVKQEKRDKAVCGGSAAYLRLLLRSKQKTNVVYLCGKRSKTRKTRFCLHHRIKPNEKRGAKRHTSCRGNVRGAAAKPRDKSRNEDKKMVRSQGFDEERVNTSDEVPEREARRQPSSKNAAGASEGIYHREAASACEPKCETQFQKFSARRRSGKAA